MPPDRRLIQRPLRLVLRDLRDETRAFRSLAAPLLDPNTIGQLDDTIVQLENIQYSSSNTPVSWVLSDRFPLKTVPSTGEYRVGGGDIRNVIAEISFVWHVTPRPANHGRLSREIEVTGDASTRILVRDVETNEELAMWRMEVATEGAPGAAFHVQIRGQNPTLPFPNWLRVPRFPTLILTPASAMEFVLAELFQDRWPEEFAHGSRYKDDWREIQRRRIRAWLGQQTEALRDHEKNSPLLVLKSLTPDADRFT